MNTLRTLVLALVVAATASARIGESLSECTRRYGQPIKVRDYESDHFEFMGDVTAFEKEGIRVFVSFFQGKVERIAFANDILKAESLRFSDEEVRVLLKANGGGLDWRPIDRTEDAFRGWRTIDGSRIAFDRGDSVIVETAACRARMKAKAEADEAKKKKDASKKMKEF